MENNNTFPLENNLYLSNESSFILDEFELMLAVNSFYRPFPTLKPIISVDDSTASSSNYRINIVVYSDIEQETINCNLYYDSDHQQAIVAIQCNTPDSQEHSNMFIGKYDIERDGLKEVVVFFQDKDLNEGTKIMLDVPESSQIDTKTQALALSISEFAFPQENATELPLVAATLIKSDKDSSQQLLVDFLLLTPVTSGTPGYEVLLPLENGILQILLTHTHISVPSAYNLFKESYLYSDNSNSINSVYVFFGEEKDGTNLPTKRGTHVAIMRPPGTEHTYTNS